MKELLYRINKWLDQKFADLKSKEGSVESFKIHPIKPDEAKSDWANFYDNTPIKPSDLINK